MPPASRSAFTLIEVMIVVVIIGILAAIAVPKLGGTRRNAYVATMRSDLRNLVTAQELFYSDSSHYATNTALLNVKPSINMTVTLAAGPGYWTATATHAQITDGFTCAIAVNTTNPLLPDVADGQPACSAPKTARASRPGQ